MSEVGYHFVENSMPDFGIPDIDPKLTERLGQIVVHWASVEYLLSMMLATFLKADQGGMQVVTNSVAVSTQTKWIRALLSAHDRESHHRERVYKLPDRADDLREERNEFVHGNWEATDCEPGTALIQTVRFDRADVIRERLVSQQDLTDLLTDIDDWIRDYVILGRELGFPRHRGDDKSIFA